MTYCNFSPLDFYAMRGTFAKITKKVELEKFETTSEKTAVFAKLFAVIAV